MGKHLEAARRRLRKRIRRRVLKVLGFVLMAAVILSLPALQALIFPPWLIRIWWRLMAGVAIVMIGTILFLPVIIEANVHTRALSGPGKGWWGGGNPLGG